MTKPLNEMSVEELLYYARNDGEFKEYREGIDEVEAFLTVLAEFMRRNELMEIDVLRYRFLRSRAWQLSFPFDADSEWTGGAAKQLDAAIDEALKANRGEV